MQDCKENAMRYCNHDVHTIFRDALQHFRKVLLQTRKQSGAPSDSTSKSKFGISPPSSAALNFLHHNSFGGRRFGARAELFTRHISVLDTRFRVFVLHLSEVGLRVGVGEVLVQMVYRTLVAAHLAEPLFSGKRGCRGARFSMRVRTRARISPMILSDTLRRIRSHISCPKSQGSIARACNVSNNKKVTKPFLHQSVTRAHERGTGQKCMGVSQRWERMTG